MDPIKSLLSKDPKSLSLGSDVSIKLLQSPNQFYDQLREELRKTKVAITFSALYLGTGDREKQLIADIKEALLDKSRPVLKVTMIFDHSRAQRGRDSSLVLLLPLVQEFGDRLSILLYQLPQFRGVLSYFLPFQIREVMGVYHCKFCVTDHSVVVTGANLSEEYFTTRQDRYWLIENNEEVIGKSKTITPTAKIVEYLWNFVTALAPACHRLEANGRLRGPIDPEHCKLQQFHMCGSPSSSLTSSSSCTSVDSLHFIPLIQHFRMNIRDEESFFLHLLRSIATTSFQSLDSNPVLHWSTPYTNFSSSLLQRMLEVFISFRNQDATLPIVEKMDSCIDLIGPDDSSHGFANATGLKSFIPRLHETALEMSIEEALRSMQYRTVQESFLKAESSFKTANGGVGKSFMNHYAFAKPGWTFHAKGFWLSYPVNSDILNAPTKKSTLPIGTYLGSSNFGERSWQRDFELGFFFYSDAIHHREFFAKDHSLLRSQCTSQLSNIGFPTTRSSAQATTGNSVGIRNMINNTFIRIVAWIVKSYL